MSTLKSRLTQAQWDRLGSQAGGAGVAWRERTQCWPTELTPGSHCLLPDPVGWLETPTGRPLLLTHFLPFIGLSSMCYGVGVIHGRSVGA